MEYEQILYEIEDRVLTLTLNRPDRLNAFTSRMMKELLDALDRADADDEVRVIIVTGAGRGFCAGADLPLSAVPTARLSTSCYPTEHESQPTVHSPQSRMVA